MNVNSSLPILVSVMETIVEAALEGTVAVEPALELPEVAHEVHALHFVSVLLLACKTLPDLQAYGWHMKCTHSMLSLQHC